MQISTSGGHQYNYFIIFAHLFYAQVLELVDRHG